MPQTHPRRWGGPLLLIVAFAAVLRLVASVNDLWLDEIWSLHLAAGMKAPWDIFTARPLLQDNNHPLNTLLLWLMRSVEPEWLLRLPAVLAGVTMVALAAAWAQGVSRTARVGAEAGACPPANGSTTASLPMVLMTAALLAGSHLLVHYGSEARGYSLAACAALAAATAIWRGEDERGWRWPALFWTAVILGSLAQPIFIVQAYAPLGLWSLGRLWCRYRKLSAVAAELARWHALPSLALALYFVGFLSRIEQAGGTARPWTPALANLLGLSLGLPLALDQERAALAARLALGVIAGVAALVLLWRRGQRGTCVFYLLAIPGGAALQLLLTRPAFLYERYLLISGLFFALLLAHALATLAASGRRAAAIAWCVLALMLAGHAVSIVHLLRDGRGQYGAALRFIIAATPADGRPILIASDHDYRNLKLIVHFRPRIPGGRRLRYVAQRDLGATGADWFLVHSPSDPKPRDQRFTIDGAGYTLRATFPTAPLSGFHWFIFHRERATIGP